MQTFIIKNALVVNEGRIRSLDLLLKKGRIERIDPEISSYKAANIEIESEGLHLFPGMIDDQVHFRQPGLTQKGDISSESKAAAAGGITSFMDMPNTLPPTLSQELLEEKYVMGMRDSVINYSFYMGVSNTNIDEVLHTAPASVCGMKIFLGSSTGDLLVDDRETLEKLFAETSMLIAVHCEDEDLIKQNLQEAKGRFPRGIPPREHMYIRSAEACYISSSAAVSLAKRFGTRLHVLHISTARELALFESGNDISNKRITAEACVHHLYFSEEDYERMGNRLKWNPAVKTAADRAALWEGVNNGRLDIIATDHAPHLAWEKDQDYLKSPSGGPLVQHAMLALLELFHEGRLSLELIAHRTAHQVARCFKIENRGFIREGYFADLVLVNLKKGQIITTEKLLAKCGWSPFEGREFSSTIVRTFVGGNLIYNNGEITPSETRGERLTFGAFHE